MSLLRDQVQRLQERLDFFEHSKILHDPHSPSSYDSIYVLHQALSTSSSARRDPDELHNDLRNLATLLGILRTEGTEKK